MSKQEKKEMIELLFNEVLRNSTRTYGKIHKFTPAVMNGRKGFLIWDYILYNELTFLNQDTDKFISIFHSFSDEEMEERFNEFAKKYGT